MSFNVSYVFEAIDNFSPALRKINSSFNKLKRNVSSVGQKLRGFGSKLLNIGKKLALGIGVSLGALAMKSLSTARDFQKSMNMVRAVSQSTNGEFVKLREKAIELGKTTQFSARQVAQGMKYLALSGMNVNEMLKAIGPSLSLAASAQSDVGSATNATTSIMHAWLFKAKGLDHMNDILVGTFIRTNTVLDDLKAGMRKLGPAARIAGFSFESAAASLGLLGQAGIPGNIAGRMLYRSLIQMAKPSAEAKKAIKTLGLQFVDSKGKMLPMVKIVRELGAAQLTNAGYATIFGTNAGPVMSALVGQGAPALKKLIEQLHNVNGLAKKIGKTQMSGLPGATARVSAAFEHLQIVFMRTNQKGIIGLINGITSLLLIISKTIPKITAFSEALLSPLVKAYDLFKKIIGLGEKFTGFFHRTASPGIATTESSQRFPGSIFGRSASLSGGAGPMSMQQQIASTLNINVDDKSGIIKSMKGTSDSDMFDMNIGTNMLMSRY